MTQIIRQRLTASVIICCHDFARIDWLTEAVNSVIKQRRKPDEIIIVFDTIEGLEEALKQKFNLPILMIPNASEHGLSLARNTGIQAASGDIVVFLDDDANAEPDWLEWILEPFNQPEVIGVGGKAIPEWLGSGKRPSWFPEEIDWTIGCMHTGFQDNARIVRNVFGSNMAFRRFRLQEIDGFDANLGGPISGDDTDICLRATAGNPQYYIVYEPKALVRHKVPQNRQTFRHIAYNAWIQGIGKATTKAIHNRDKRALATEKRYLGSLIVKFLPLQARNMFKHPKSSIGKITAVVIVVASLGLGYMLTITKIHHVNLNKYKTS